MSPSEAGQENAQISESCSPCVISSSPHALDKLIPAAAPANTKDYCPSTSGSMGVPFSLGQGWVVGLEGADNSDGWLVELGISP